MMRETRPRLTLGASAIGRPLAITGIAGPTGGTADKPVGTVFIGCAVEGRTTVEKHQFSGDRELIQERSAHAALIQLWRRLTHD